MRSQSAARVPDVSDTAPGVLAEFLRRHPTPATRVMLVADDADDPITVTVPSEALKMFIEILDHSGAALYACQMAADMMDIKKEDLLPQVKDIITAMDFFDKSEGAQTIFI